MLRRQVPLSLGSTLGNLEGVRFLGLLREEKHYIVNNKE